MTRKKRRMMVVGLAMVALASATALVLTALDDSLVYFYSPTDVVAKQPGERRIRIGGLVEEGSVTKEGKQVNFRVTDLRNSLPVTFTGVLPDLFREKQGVVTEGRLGPDGIFQATNVLAKHDETYMPKEVADAIKASGEWKGKSP